MKSNRWVIATALMLPLYGCAAIGEETHSTNTSEVSPNETTETDSSNKETSVSTETTDIETEMKTGTEAETGTSSSEMTGQSGKDSWSGTSDMNDSVTSSSPSTSASVSGSTPTNGVSSETKDDTVSESPSSEGNDSEASSPPELEEDKEAEPEQPVSPPSTEADLGLGTLVVVNKQLGLESWYRPSDLVEPNIPFVSSASGERRTMRREAAAGAERLFQAAAAEGINIKATSAFRSYAYQEVLFNAYVERDGKEAALRYSAPPGHSEHQTGLAIDVSGQSVGYELTQQLGSTTEGRWLAANAHRFGFIVRYGREFESQTGYMYEPWHLRYVGKTAAGNIASQNIWLERYMGL